MTDIPMVENSEEILTNFQHTNTVFELRLKSQGFSRADLEFDFQPEKSKVTADNRTIFTADAEPVMLFGMADEDIRFQWIWDWMPNAVNQKLREQITEHPDLAKFVGSQGSSRICKDPMHFSYLASIVHYFLEYDLFISFPTETGWMYVGFRNVMYK